MEFCCLNILSIHMRVYVCVNFVDTYLMGCWKLSSMDAPVEVEMLHLFIIAGHNLNPASSYIRFPKTDSHPGVCLSWQLSYNRAKHFRRTCARKAARDLLVGSSHFRLFATRIVTLRTRLARIHRGLNVRDPFPNQHPTIALKRLMSMSSPLKVAMILGPVQV